MMYPHHANRSRSVWIMDRALSHRYISAVRSNNPHNDWYSAGGADATPPREGWVTVSPDGVGFPAPHVEPLPSHPVLGKHGHLREEVNAGSSSSSSSSSSSCDDDARRVLNEHVDAVPGFADADAMTSVDKATAAAIAGGEDDTVYDVDEAVMEEGAAPTGRGGAAGPRHLAAVAATAHVEPELRVAEVPRRGSGLQDDAGNSAGDGTLDEEGEE